MTDHLPKEQNLKEMTLIVTHYLGHEFKRRKVKVHETKKRYGVKTLGRMEWYDKATGLPIKKSYSLSTYRYRLEIPSE